MHWPEHKTSHTTITPAAPQSSPAWPANQHGDQAKPSHIQTCHGNHGDKIPRLVVQQVVMHMAGITRLHTPRAFPQRAIYISQCHHPCQPPAQTPLLTKLLEVCLHTSWPSWMKPFIFQQNVTCNLSFLCLTSSFVNQPAYFVLPTIPSMVAGQDYSKWWPCTQVLPLMHNCFKKKQRFPCRTPIDPHKSHVKSLSFSLLTRDLFEHFLRIL